MMRIGPKASNEALIQVSHVDNDIDGQIFRCKVKALQEGEKSYTAVIKGKSFELLRLKEGNGRLHIPDEQATGWWPTVMSCQIAMWQTRNISLLHIRINKRPSNLKLPGFLRGNITRLIYMPTGERQPRDQTDRPFS